MFVIKRVEIDGFWGTLNLSTDFHSNVNVFIGHNGTGKTTFINILQAILTVDLDLLQSLQFDQVRLWLLSPKKTRKVTVEKLTGDIAFDKIRFKIGRRSFSLPFLPKDFEFRRRRMPSKFIEEYSELREAVAELVNISWLSVHRELFEEEAREAYQRRVLSEKNPVDRRIDELMKRLTSYQLQLESEMTKLSKDFEKQVLVTMLYDKNFDTFMIDKGLKLDLDEVKEGLLHAYDDLGALDSAVSERIENHTKKITDSLFKVNRWEKEKDKSITIDDIMPLSLLRRTQHIVQLSTDVERKKRALSRPLNTFLEIVRNFIEDKVFELDPSSEGAIMIKKGKSNLDLEQLSSGEKQLVILLTETLLQREKTFIFIADEPELSLHIEWQRKILSSINTLNPMSQVIVATHAPEIAGAWPENIIPMEDIMYEQS